MGLHYRIIPEAIPSTGIVYADMEPKLRSAHLGHGLAEYRPGCVISFYSNCSGKRNLLFPGHNSFGWVEYRRSSDGGLRWDEPKVLPYSWEALLNEPFTIACEKAVSPAEDIIIAFCLRNTNPDLWEPYLEPMVVRSEDGGETWSEPLMLCDKKGRLFDAMVHEGIIYALMHDCEGFPSTSPEHRYYLYESADQGSSFTLRGCLPGDPTGHAYGNMVLREDGALICYLYNKQDEYHLTYHISYDLGLTWAESGTSFCAKRIRNPQVAKVKGGFILHGRSGCESPELPSHFVLYTGTDGITWDDGIYLCEAERGEQAYYSNNLVLDQPDGSQRVLIQSSVPYDGPRVNVAHWILEIP